MNSKMIRTMEVAATVFLLASIFSWLQAETTFSMSFSLNLQEWLVLEVSTEANSMTEAGNRGLAVENEITTGQSIKIRALLSVGHEKTIVLRSTVYSKEEIASETLQWIGEGDLSGSGFLKAGQESVIAVWKGQGLKSGKLLFLNPEGQNGKAYRAIFVLSSP